MTFISGLTIICAALAHSAGMPAEGVAGMVGLGLTFLATAEILRVDRRVRVEADRSAALSSKR